MDRMSERLQGLIADGKKALGREIVVAEGVVDSTFHGDSGEDGMGDLDDSEGGWEDAEDSQISRAVATVGVPHPGGRVGRAWERPRKPTGSTVYTGRIDEAYTRSGRKH
jgi:hypothetical protein